MFFTIEKLSARTRQLEPLRFVDMESIAPMTAMDAQNAGDQPKD